MLKLLQFTLILCTVYAFTFERASYLTRDRGSLCSKVFGTRKDAVPYPGYGKKKTSGKNDKVFTKKFKFDSGIAVNMEIMAVEESRKQSSVGGQIKLADEERINKVLARAGVASRRGADDFLLSGRVAVNGNIVNEPGFKVNVRKDIIVVDGERISLPDDRGIYWIAINKPKNVITSMDDDKDRETLSSLVPKSKDLRIVPVGRLERDTTGIMVLTNEVGWLHPLTHRSYKRDSNRYEIVVQGLVCDHEHKIEDLRRGGVKISREYDAATGAAIRSSSHEQSGYERRHSKGKLNDPADSLPPVNVKIMDTDSKSKLSLLEVTMEEIYPHQIQRLCAQVLGCTLISIKRTQFGPVKLGSLKRGQWRELTEAEVAKLKASVSVKDRVDDGYNVGLTREKVSGLEDGVNSLSKGRKSLTRVSSHTSCPDSKSRGKKPGAGYASRGGVISEGHSGDVGKSSRWVPTASNKRRGRHGSLQR